MVGFSAEEPTQFNGVGARSRGCFTRFSSASRLASEKWPASADRSEPATVFQQVGMSLQSRPAFWDRRQSWSCLRRHSLSDDRDPAPDSNVASWEPPYRFVHQIQRFCGVVRFADNGVTMLQDQFDFIFAHGPALERGGTLRSDPSYHSPFALRRGGAIGMPSICLCTPFVQSTNIR